MGPPWIERGNIYVYSLSERSYKKVAIEYRRAAWIDDNRILLSKAGKVALVDLRDGKIREIATGELSLASAPASREHFVLLGARTERDVWLASLPQP